VLHHFSGISEQRLAKIATELIDAYKEGLRKSFNCKETAYRDVVALYDEGIYDG
jgi:hypothetical protein